ncbi:MAG: hypothetical protein K0R59_1632 [Sphingobacterium sp.]|jgi:RNA polymerase sigma-70 factor (ECF subfamily)|nr:hypothetical protein [Sphingobacterium sp.]
MNPSYISFIKPIEIRDMHNSFVETHWEEPIQTPLLLTEKRLKELYHEHYPFLCQISLNIVKEVDTAKDIVQNFFLQCWERKSSMRIRGPFKAYAYRSIFNASVKHQKKIRLVDYDSEYIFQEADKIAYQSDTERHALENERFRVLWKAIEQLPDKRKEIFLLSQEKGMTYNQIADSLNISVNTVKTQIKRALVFLRSESKLLISVLGWLLLIK